MVSKAPAWEITDIELSNDYEPPLDLFYKIEIKIVANSDEDGDIFEPEPGQLIALTDRRPTCIDDLSTPGNSYSIASINRVRKKEDAEDVYEAKILTSKPIELKQYLQKGDTYIYGFGVYLCNMTTFIRIWNALNSDPDGPHIHIIKQLLQPDSGVRK
jgi:senataxin